MPLSFLVKVSIILLTSPAIARAIQMDSSFLIPPYLSCNLLIIYTNYLTFILGKENNFEKDYNLLKWRLLTFKKVLVVVLNWYWHLQNKEPQPLLMRLGLLVWVYHSGLSLTTGRFVTSTRYSMTGI